MNAKSKPPEVPAFATYLAKLKDSAVSLSLRNLKALAGLEPAHQASFQQLWAALPPSRRREVVKALLELSEENLELDFNPLFFCCLEDPDEVVRATALEGLWENENPQLFQCLLSLLKDPAPSVREAVMLHFSRLAYQAQVGELSPAKSQIISTTLLHWATDLAQPLEICRRAIEGLGYFDSPAGQEVISQASQHPKQQMRESALVAMGRSMNPIWLPFIARELTSEVSALRYEAAKAVGEFAETGQPLLAALLPLTEDADTEICLAAIWALGQIGGPHAERILQRLALTRDAARAQAAQEALSEVALGEWG